MSSDTGTMTVEKGYKVTEVGVIPEEWGIASLGSVCTKITDGSHSSPPATTEGYFMASVKDMRRNGFDFSKCKVISEADHRKLVKQGCKPLVGDVLIAKDGSVLEQVFVQEKNEDITILSSIAILRPQKEILKSVFLSQFLSWNYFRAKIRKEFTSGSALPRIILKNFRLIHIPLPPFPEQEKIAEILSTVDEHIGETEDLIEKTETLKKGMMQRLLTQGIGHTEFKNTEIGRIPAEWEVQPLSTAFYVNKHSMPSTTDGNMLINYIDIQSVAKGRISEYKQLKFSDSPSRARRIVHSGDVIISTVRPYLKAFAQITSTLANQVCSTGFAVLSTRNANHASNNYLSHFVFSDTFIKQLEEKMVGSNYPAVNSSDVGNTHISLPSIQEQRQIADILTAIDDQIEEYRSKLGKLNQLKTGLMQQLLTGRIRVQV